MKWFVTFIAVWGLAGCASQSNQPDASRAEAIAKARTELAAAYYARAQYGVSLEELANALRADSSYAPAYNVRGLVHMALRENTEAENDFKRSLNLDSSSSDAHNNYGWFLCQNGREREAVKHFLIAASDPLYTTPGKAYLNAGVCSKKVGELQDAEMYLQRAMILQPNLPEALVGLADAAFIRGDYASAKTYFRRFEQASSAQMSVENLLLAVRIEHKLGNRNAESGYATQLKKNFPDSREAKLLGQIR
jgi:type IV pilus assembly protein PilF